MARQESLIKLNGKIGDLSFYKDKRGYQARMKTGPTKDQINNDPRFQRTKENGQEFGRAANGSKQFRNQLRELLAQGADPQFSRRLTGRMHRVLKLDDENARGERKVLVANLPQLVGVECNLRAQLGEVFFMKARPVYDRSSGEGIFELPEMTAKKVIKALEGATHVQIQLVAAEFDAQNPDADEISIARSTYLDIGKSEVSAAETLSVQLLPQAESGVILLMGISYLQHVNGGYYPLSNGMYNALTVVQVDVP
ncbi:hypothetical protein [Sphingobacterium pedocola]|uniref:Uncharacterized protein n=1 Tax=Sphingobacterium pedocola TaxID=2082722 RepID=A0ABR9TBE2_9SPHI|nr:hypothetical protein [Sphingobacterium pedocola]MBE8722690.1 hypothetical protein [Sphingobacterium pedocola]